MLRDATIKHRENIHSPNCSRPGVHVVFRDHAPWSETLEPATGRQLQHQVHRLRWCQEGERTATRRRRGGCCQQQYGRRWEWASFHQRYDGRIKGDDVGKTRDVRWYCKLLGTRDDPGLLINLCFRLMGTRLYNFQDGNRQSALPWYKHHNCLPSDSVAQDWLA